MRNDPTSVFAGVGIALALAALIYGPFLYRHRRRRLAFRAAAMRAGLEPGDGSWVDAPCGSTRIKGQEHYRTYDVPLPIKSTNISASIPGAFPEAFNASTHDNATGVVRTTFPTASGKRTVYVRGLVQAETLAFVTEPIREALAEGLDLAFDSELVAGMLRLSTNRWYTPEELTATFAGFMHITRALSAEPAAYR